MKHFISFSFMVLFVSFAVQAQINKVSGVDMNDIAENISEGGALVREVDTYKGTPYFSDWVKGYLILKNGAKTKMMTFRYNLRYNRIEFAKDGGLYVITADKLNAFKIKTTGPYITFKNGFNTPAKKISSNSFLRIIVDGKVKLLAHHTSELHKNIPNYGIAGDVHEFVSDTDYYIVTADEIFHKIDLEMDEAYEELPGDNEKVKEYMKRLNLSSLNAEQRIKKIVQYYNLFLNAKIN